jgi:hypothetical protein
MGVCVCIYREDLTFVARFMALCFTATSAPLAARRIQILPMNQYTDTVRNEVVTIHRSQEMLKMLFLYTQTFLAPMEDILIYHLKLFCRNICNFPTNVFFWLFFCLGVAVVNFVLQTTPDEEITRIKIR